MSMTARRQPPEPGSRPAPPPGQPIGLPVPPPMRPPKPETDDLRERLAVAIAPGFIRWAIDETDPERMDLVPRGIAAMSKEIADFIRRMP